jgi:hypothetical protein
MRRFIVASAITAIALLTPAWAMASNKETAQHIADVLRKSGRLHNYEFDVKYKDGTAWLIGRVADQEQRAIAAKLARQLPEVSQVINQLVAPAAEKAEMKSQRRSNTAPEPVVRFATPRRGVADDESLSSTRTVDANVQTAADEQEMTSDEQPARPRPMMRTKATHRKAPRAQTQSQESGMQAQRAMPQQVADERGSVVGPQGQRVKLIPVKPGPNGTLIPIRQQATAANTAQDSGRQARRKPFGFRTASAQMPTMAGEGGPNRPMPSYLPTNAGAAPATYDQPHLPNYSWPSYAAYPNYAGLTYPKQYSPTAWPYIGPFYPYPQVPLGWRKVSLEWADGWWFLDFDDQSGSAACCH